MGSRRNSFRCDHITNYGSRSTSGFITPSNPPEADPEDDDYPAAGSYLSLLYEETAAAKYVEQLRKAPVSKFKAKDIFRASGLPLLDVSNSHVEHDQKKVLAGKSLSPLLLVRTASHQTVVIAVTVTAAEDITRHVEQTWTHCARIGNNPAVRFLLPLLGGPTQRFVRSFPLMKRAYAQGAMAFGLFVATKSA